MILHLYMHIDIDKYTCKKNLYRFLSPSIVQSSYNSMKIEISKFRSCRGMEQRDGSNRDLSNSIMKEVF